MKAKNYPIVDTLPVNAIKVSSFAKDKTISVGYVYVQHTRGKADYSIVNFQGWNFVIPNS